MPITWNSREKSSLYEEKSRRRHTIKKPPCRIYTLWCYTLSLKLPANIFDSRNVPPRHQPQFFCNRCIAYSNSQTQQKRKEYDCIARVDRLFQKQSSREVLYKSGISICYCSVSLWLAVTQVSGNTQIKIFWLRFDKWNEFIQPVSDDPSNI